MAVDTLFEQALQLADEERGELVARLLRKLDPEGSEELVGEPWEAAWTVEIDRRVDDVRAGRVALVDGDEVLAEVRALVDRS